MVSQHGVITFLVCIQNSISSLQTHNGNRDGRSRHLARILFFQAKDGIRDHCVTGFQTCALPISLYFASFDSWSTSTKGVKGTAFPFPVPYRPPGKRKRVTPSRQGWPLTAARCPHCWCSPKRRSEERRVGNECRPWCWAYAHRQDA